MVGLVQASGNTLPTGNREINDGLEQNSAYGTSSVEFVDSAGSCAQPNQPFWIKHVKTSTTDGRWNFAARLG